MDAGFEFAQARIQGRLARLPTDGLWLRLASQKGLPAYLESARPTPLGPWLASFSSASDAHEIDRTVREHFASAVEEVARWVPEPWAPAVRWTRWLPYLPDVRALLRDAGLSGAEAEVAGLPVPRPGAEHGLGVWAMRAGLEWFAGVDTAGRDPVEAWLEGWRALWPPCDETCAASLESLVTLLRRHGQAFPLLSDHAGWTSRRTLVQQARFLFRRHSGEPAAAFAYLTLVALALEKLRGDLTRRSLFPLPEVAS